VYVFLCRSPLWHFTASRNDRYEPVPLADVIEQVCIVHSCDRKNVNSGCAVQEVCQTHRSLMSLCCTDTCKFEWQDFHDTTNKTYELLDRTTGFITNSIASTAECDIWMTPSQQSHVLMTTNFP
jgi:hypothetical protein